MIKEYFFKSKSITKRLFWISLLFISMIGGTGLSSLSNQGAFAQDYGVSTEDEQYGEQVSSGGQEPSYQDTDYDGVDDAYDPCIDPNDPQNTCAYASEGSPSSEGEQISTPQESVPQENAANGEQQYPVSTGEEVSSGGQEPSYQDTDYDGVDDAYDPCIDPNDPQNTCNVEDRDHDGQLNEVDLCPDDGSNLCPEAQAKQIVDSCVTASEGYFNCIINSVRTATGETKEAICRDSAENRYINEMRECGAQPQAATTNLPATVQGGIQGQSGPGVSISVPLGGETTYSLQPGSVQATCEKLSRNTQADEYNKCISSWPDYDFQELPTADQLKEVCEYQEIYDWEGYVCQNRAGETYLKDKFGVKVGIPEDCELSGVWDTLSTSKIVLKRCGVLRDLTGK